jgi:Ca2+-binding RTX toxin-like protein
MRRITLLLASMALTVCVAASVAWAAVIQCSANEDCFGTHQADTLTGTSGGDRIFGVGGPDTIRGLGSGLDEFDKLSGGSGDDVVRGGGGEDEINGGGGEDELKGGSATDRIFAGNGDDTVFGGTGDDGIVVYGDQAHGFEDEVFCGPGVDEVALDANDTFATALDGAQECERIQVVPQE